MPEVLKRLSLARQIDKISRKDSQVCLSSTYMVICIVSFTCNCSLGVGLCLCSPGQHWFLETEWVGFQHMLDWSHCQWLCISSDYAKFMVHLFTVNFYYYCIYSRFASCVECALWFP